MERPTLEVEWEAPLTWQRTVLRSLQEWPEVRHLRIAKGRQIGGTVLARRAAVELLCRHSGPTEVDYYVTPTYPLGKKPFRLLSHLARSVRGAGARLGTVNKAERHIDWLWGSQLQFRSVGSDPGDAVGETMRTGAIFDEAGMFPDEAWDYLYPAFAVHDAISIGLGTFRGKNRFYEDFRRGLDEDGNSPLISGREPVDPRFLSLRLPSVVEVAPWWTPERVEAARATMSDALFRQEILAEPLDAAAQFFNDLDRWSVAERAAPVPGARYVIGVDLAKHQDYTSGRVVRVDVASPLIGVEVDEWRDQHTRWDLQIARIKSRARVWNDALVCVDATGVGDAIFDGLIAEGVDVIPYKFTESSKPALVENYLAKLQTGQFERLSKRADPVGYQEHADFQQEPVIPRGRATGAQVSFRYGHAPGKHDDTVMGSALAVHAITQASRDVIDYVPVV